MNIIDIVSKKTQYWRYRFAFRAREYLGAGRFPVHVDIELSGKCQLACTMCPYGEGTFDAGKQGMMSEDMACEALDQAWYGGASSIKLNFRGEPGLSPLLIPMVKEANAYGFTEVAINTNLTAFSPRRLRELCDAGLDLLIVSVDGATAETYEAVRVNGDFEKLCGNLLIMRAFPRRPRLRVQMTVQDRNRHEVPLMRRKFGRIADELTFNPERHDNSGERKLCPQPSQRLVVMWDGAVGACCHNWDKEAVIGRFPQQSLQEIWDSPEARELRRKAAKPEMGEPCRSCKVGSSYR